MEKNKNEEFFRLEQEHDGEETESDEEAQPTKREYELMRQNPNSYAMFIDRFASSIIGAKNWGYEGDNPMKDVVGGRTQFNDVITVSDEAFMLVCMESYRERWLAEVKKKDALVRTLTFKVCCAVWVPI